LPLFSIMKSDRDHTKNVHSSNVEAAKSRFLDSMGLGENSLRELAESGQTRDSDQPVALSAQSEDIDLPGATPKNVSIRVKNAGGMKVSASSAATISVERAAGVNAKPQIQQKAQQVPEAKISKVEEKAPEPVQEAEASAEIPESIDPIFDSDDLLHLNCPKCDGELVIRPEHVGIDGACVWCQAGIVASRSSIDGKVKVYPVFQPGVPAKNDDMTASAAVEEVAPEKTVEAEVAPELSSENQEPVVERAPLPEISSATFE